MRVSLIRMWQPDCPVVGLSSRFEEVRIYVLDSRILDDNVLKATLVIMHDSVEFKDVANALIKSGASRVELLWRSGSASSVELFCRPTKAFKSVWGRSLATLRPVMASNGFEDWLLLTPNQKVEYEIVSEIRDGNDVEVVDALSLSPEEVAMLSALMSPSLMVRLISALRRSRLTLTQLTVLKEALTSGYYEHPRRADLSDLARIFGVSKAAVAKNLRRAEKKAIELVLTIFNQFNHLGLQW